MKNKLEVKLRGSGYKVSAFLINQSILKILKNASISEALYEDNPISLVKNIAKDYFCVTKGFDIDAARDLECTVSINEKKIKVKDIGYLDFGAIFEEEFSSKQDETLIARAEASEPLGSTIKVKKNEMFIIETTDIKDMELEVSFESAQNITLGDLELGVTYLDADSDLAFATYHCGLLNGMERDISSVIFNNKKFEFEIADIFDSYPSRFFLATKDDSGNWKADLVG